MSRTGGFSSERETGGRAGLCGRGGYLLCAFQKDRPIAHGILKQGRVEMYMFHEMIVNVHCTLVGFFVDGF